MYTSPRPLRKRSAKSQSGYTYFFSHSTQATPRMPIDRSDVSTTSEAGTAVQEYLRAVSPSCDDPVLCPRQEMGASHDAACYKHGRWSRPPFTQTPPKKCTSSRNCGRARKHGDTYLKNPVHGTAREKALQARPAGAVSDRVDEILEAGRSAWTTQERVGWTSMTHKHRVT